jgi:hypothetical protein
MDESSRDDSDLSPAQVLSAIDKLIRKNQLLTFEPLLPMLLRMRGHPFTLKDHYHFEPMFRARKPQKIVFKCARQVGKTTTFGADGCLMAAARPHFYSLFVTPQFEQIRRFSTTNIRPFIRESPLRHLWQSTTTEDSVLQRTFTNGSRMMFSFAGLDADRIRGISSHRVAFDESVRIGTLVAAPTGDMPIETLRPGDLIYAIDTHGQRVHDTIRTVSDHGVRDCYEIQLEDGRCFEATSESFIATPTGWRTVEGLVADLADAVAGADAAGYDARRRGDIPHGEDSPVHQSARVGAAGLQRREIPGLARVRTHATTAPEESRLRQVVERLGDIVGPGVRPVHVLVLPGRAQTGVRGLVVAADVGSRGVVVPGRRNAAAAGCGVQHAVVQPSRGGDAGCLVDAYGYAGRSAPSAESAPQQDLLGRAGQYRCGEAAVSAHPPVDCAEYDVQVGRDDRTGTDPVQLVRDGFHADRYRGRNYHHANRLLRIAAVRASSRPRQRAALPQSPGCDCREERETAPAIPRDPRRQSRKGATVSGCLRREESRRRQRAQARKIATESCGARGESVGMPPLRAYRAAGSEGLQDEILRGVSCTRDAGDQAAISCASSRIVSVRWTGQHRVFDLETATYRSFFANGIAVHNCQDMDKDHIPIILETLSADKEYGLEQYSGTSKTTTTSLAILWQQSSQAEFWIPCQHCTTNGARTYNIPSIDHDIERMLGPLHMDISEDCAGIICRKCAKPLRPRTGRWVHRYPEKRWDFAGYHIPQPIIPLHYSSPKKWAALLGKRERGTAAFVNEVLGEEYDAGQRLITVAELQAACNLGVENNWREPSPEVMRRARDARTRVLAVDWGGGGESGHSYTAFALLGFHDEGRIEVLWGCRSYGIDHLVEAAAALRWFQHFQCDYLVHDYGGAGALRETMLLQAGVPETRVMPMTYVRSSSQNLVVPVVPTEKHTRTRFHLDKTRSLLMTIAAIRLGLVRFFKYDYVDSDNEGLMVEFLRLKETRSDMEIGGSYYKVLSDATGSDDFAQAVNIGCAAIWHLHDAYPHLAHSAGLELNTTEIARLAEPDPYSDPWEDGESSFGF